MLKSYVTTVLRTLRKQKGYAVINVAGLGLGIACSLLIYLFVQDELSYDRFHEHADHIYRIAITSSRGDQESTHLLAPRNMGHHLVNDLPSVVKATKVASYGSMLLTRGEEQFYENGVFGVDSTFFEVFSFTLLQGSPETALVEPRSAVLSQSFAQKYFDNQDPVGQTLTLNTRNEFTVTGVVADVPSNSHFRFNMLLSFDPERLLGSPDTWLGGAYPMYLVLEEGTEPAEVEAAIARLKEKYLSEESARRTSYSLQPLTDIHLYSNLAVSELGENGDIRYVYLFSAIALLIVLIACINYMNLATARAAQRAREVGVRKVLGAHKGHLIRQFLGESLLMSTLAVVVSIALVELSLPLVNQLVQKEMVVSYFDAGSILPMLLGIGLIVGVVAGGYPAFALSAFQPVRVLKGQTAGGPSAVWLRKGLVVFQFVVSTVLIIATIVVHRQLDYVQTKRLGFDKEQVVMIRTRGAIAESYGAFKEAVAGLAHVNTVSATHIQSMFRFGTVWAYPEGWDRESDGVTTNLAYVDPHFVQTMGIEMAEGRDFDLAQPTDLQDAILINEAAARKYGWSEAVGKTLHFDEDAYRVIGVVSDYHYLSLKEDIAPLVLKADLEKAAYTDVAVRASGGQLPATLAALEALWKQFAPARPFEYQFVDEAFERFYRAEERLGQIFGGFSFLAILIACLGLFGLAAYTAQQRTKEIGIRKVLGARITSIVVLLSKTFLTLVLVAFLVAAPLAYFSMTRWLEVFAYHIDVSWQILAVAGGMTLVIALLAVGYQSIKAALTDPAKSLRYE